MRPSLPKLASISPKLRKAVNQRAAIERLRLACQFVTAHMSKPIFQRHVMMNGRRVIVRLEWPCIMSVFDLKTGEPLAVSRFGNPGALSPDFEPPDPDQDYMLPEHANGKTKQGSRNGQPPATN